jgi:hypothetical protein
MKMKGCRRSADAKTVSLIWIRLPGIHGVILTGNITGSRILRSCISETGIPAMYGVMWGFGGADDLDS